LYIQSIPEQVLIIREGGSGGRRHQGAHGLRAAEMTKEHARHGKIIRPEGSEEKEE